MGRPGWSITQPSEAQDLTLLPLNCRWESNRVLGVKVSKIRNVTRGGRRYNWENYRRYYREFRFRFPEQDNDAYMAMFEASISEAIWFAPDSSDLSTLMHIQNEDDEYLPQNIGQPGGVQGILQMIVEWTWRISTETEEEELEP